MARPSYTRRGVAPTASAAPSGRVTRSQSAEPPEHLPSTRGVQQSSTEPVKVNRATSRRANIVAADTADNLVAVQEEDESDHENDNASIQDDSNDAISNDNVPGDEENAGDESRRESNPRESIASGFSGTTAKTSFSQEEIMELDIDIMIDELPSLASAANDMGKILVPSGVTPVPEVWKEIQQAGSKTEKRYQLRLNTIQLHKPNFGNEEYIQPRNVVRAVLKVHEMEEVPAAVWRPDDILLNVNLVLMLNDLLITCDPSDRMSTNIDVLERLDAAFPSAIAGSGFDATSLDFYLALAVQLTIARLETYLRSEPSSSPSEIIDTVLYDDDQSFKYNGALGIADATAQVRQEVMDKVSQLAQELKLPFQKTGSRNASAAANKLRSKYRWAHFIDHALRYFVHRKASLDDRIKAAGGVDRIAEGLTKEVKRRASLEASGAPIDKYAKSTANVPASTLKALEKELIQAEQLSQVPPPRTAPPMTDTAANPDSEADEIVLANHADVSPAIINEASADLKKKAGANKSFFDRQQDAVRLSWDLSQASQVQTISSSNPSRVNKRTIEEADEEEPETFDPTPDDGFQTDTRNLAAADQRRKDVAYEPLSLTSPEPSAPSSLSASAPTTGEPVVHRTVAERPAKRARKNPGSSIPPAFALADDSDGDIPKSTMYQAAKNIAKSNRVMSTQPKPTQVRTPWDDSEEDALLELIEKYGEGGVSWAHLKNMDTDQKLARRDPEAMRFKARNMKVTFLTARVALPQNWKYVPLDKKAKDKLEAEGIPYHQEQIRKKRGQ